MSHSEVAHRWANQIGNLRTKDNAYASGKMHYVGTDIFSYGGHFMLARLDVSRNTVRRNAYIYSPSTSQHQSIVWGAIDTDKYKTVSYRFYNNNQPDSINYASYISEFKCLLSKLTKARQPEIYVIQIERLQAEVKTAATYLRTLSKDKKNIEVKKFLEWTPGVDPKETAGKTTEALRVAKERAAKRREAARIAYEKKREEEAKASLSTWLNGEVERVPSSVRYLTDTYIRVNGDKIETSQGMSVTLNDALRVFRLWKAGKALGCDIRTTTGTVWQCTKVNGTIKFGCHVVSFEHASETLAPFLPN